MAVPFTLLVLVVLACVLMLWTGGSTSPETVAVLAQRPEADPNAAVVLPAPVGTRDAEPVSLSTPVPLPVTPGEAAAARVHPSAAAQAVPRASRTFSVQVVDSFGLAVPEAQVEAKAPDVPSREPTITITDAEGRCDIVATGSIVLCASKADTGTSGEWLGGCMPDAVWENPALAALATEAQSVRLVLHRTARVSGVVVDSDGTPQPGATVFVRPLGIVVRNIRVRTPEPVRTDELGHYAVQLDAPCQATISATTVTGDETPERMLSVDDGDAVEANLRLMEALVLAGIVIDEAGAPVASAHVSLQYPADDAEGTSRADGAFTLQVEAEGEFGVIVSARGYVPERAVSVTLEKGRRSEPVTLRLLKSQSIAGRVIWDDGAPAERAMMSSQPIVPKGVEQPAGRFSPTWSDALGRFELPDVDPRCLHEVRAMAGKPVPVFSVVADVEAGTRDLVVVLSRAEAKGRSVSVVVLDDHSGNPVTEYDLSWGMWIRGLHAGETIHVRDPAGRHTLTGLGIYERALLVEAAGYPPRTVGPLADGDFLQDVVVRLAHLGNLSVRVVDESSAPRPEARVLAARAAGDRHVEEFIDPETCHADVAGVASFSSWLPGRSMVQAEAGALVSDLAFVDVLPDQSNEITLIVRSKPERGALVVHLADAEGRPVEGAEVHVNNMTKLGAGEAAGEFTGVTDASGQARFPDLLPGEYWVWPRLEGSFIGPRWVAVAGGAPIEASFRTTDG